MKPLHSNGNAITEYALPALIVGAALMGLLVTLDMPGSIRTAMGNTQHGDLQNKQLMLSRYSDLTTAIDPEKPIKICVKNVCAEVAPANLAINDTTGGLGIDMSKLAALFKEATEPPAPPTGQTPEELAYQLSQQGMELAKSLEVVNAICGTNGEACSNPASLNAKLARAYFMKNALPMIVEIGKTSEAMGGALSENPTYCNGNPAQCELYQTAAKDYLHMAQSMFLAHKMDYQDLQSMQSNAMEMCMTVANPADCML